MASLRWVLGAAFAGAILLAGAGRAGPRAPRVLLDQSHEFLFAVDHLGVWLASEGFEVVSSRATFPARDLASFDVLVLHQSSIAVEYERGQLDAIRAFVEGGGGVYLMGNRAGFPAELPRYPLEDVAALFGQRLAAGEGQARITSLEVGRGRVAVTGEHALLGKPADEASQRLLGETFRWLAKKNKGEALAPAPGGVSYRPADLTLSRGGLEVRYTAPLREGAAYLLDAYQRFHDALHATFGTRPTRPLRVEALATGGGAFTAYPLIAIGVLSPDRSGTNGFLLWELTNAWYLPTAPSFTEG